MNELSVHAALVVWYDFHSIHRQVFSVVKLVHPLATLFIGIHFDRLCSGGHRSGQVCPGFGGSWLRCTLTSIFKPQRAVPLGSILPWSGWVCHLAPEASLFRGMPTGPEEFLEPPGTSGLWLCARTHLKKDLVPHSSCKSPNTNLPVRIIL